MAVMGACVSPNPEDREFAHVWLTCVEEMVFRDADLNADETDPSVPSKQKMQSLQAAYIVCVLQAWEGAESDKRRIRSKYSTVVDVSPFASLC